MQVDLFMEFAAPAFAGKSVGQVFDDGLALASAADRGGFGGIWLAEHHFLKEYSLSSAPEILLAAIARETKKLELGFGIIPLPIHDVVRVAEKLATLDFLSGGRVRWGVGRGVTQTELNGFGVDPGATRDIFKDRLHQLRSILKVGSYTKNGEEFELQPRPAVDLCHGWMAAVSPESFDLAAELDMDVMAGPFKPWPLVKADLSGYRRLQPDGRTSFTLAVYCEEDHKSARDRAKKGLVWAYKKILEITRPLMKGQVESYEHYSHLGWVTPLFEKVLSLSVLEAMGLAVVGDPDHVRKKLRELHDSGLDRVSLIIGGGDLELAEATRAVQLLAHEVIPNIARPAHTNFEAAVA